MRTIIELEDSDAARLDAWAKSQKISRTEAVRRAVSQMLARTTPPQGSGFGLWANGQPILANRDGLALQRELREEWPE